MSVPKKNTQGVPTMANEPKAPPQGMIQVVTGDEMSRGRYSNNMLVSHTPEEFIIDWLLNSPAGMHPVAPPVLRPGHFKRSPPALSAKPKKDQIGKATV